MPQQILLIDDFRPIHPLVTSLLGDEAVMVHSAFDAESSLAMAASLQPDLIMLDVDMPDMDGFEACRRLKADPVTANLPIIFLTGRATSEETVHGLNLGAVDYVIKPFKPAELQSRVRAALRTSHQIRSLEEKALIDSLTGLGNRAMFEKRLAAEIALRVRSGNVLSCIVLDVDHFKDINESYGNPFGDHVLTKIGYALAQICRVEDVACRHGGEEFVILMPQTSADSAALAAERMRIAIASIPFSRRGHSISVTCSFGIAEALGTSDRLMMQRADQALYQSKAHGRNCVSIAATTPIAQTLPA